MISFSLKNVNKNIEIYIQLKILKKMLSLKLVEVLIFKCI